MRVGPARNNYLCTKGRFGWDAVHHSERLTTPKMRVGGELVDCTWDEALSVVATNLKVIKNKHGAEKHRRSRLGPDNERGQLCVPEVHAHRGRDEQCGHAREAQGSEGSEHSILFRRIEPRWESMT